MPIYEYECLRCGRRTERLQRVDDPPLAACPHCGGEVKKLLSAPAFQFKGSGWYVTDYGGRGKAKTAEGTDDKAGKSEEKAAGADKDLTTGGETAKSAAKTPGSAKPGGSVSSE